MMKLDIYGEAASLHISVASLMTSTKISDILCGTVISANLGFVANNTKFCIRFGDGSPKFERSSTYTYRIQEVHEVSVTRLTTSFAFHRICVRFQWHIKQLYLNSTGRAWGFSDTSNDYIWISQDVFEVSVTHPTTLLVFHRTCVRFQWQIKRLYWHSTGRAWGFSDTSNDFIWISQDVLEVSVTHPTTLLVFHRMCVTFQ
jgi:hypothetical protein